MKKEYVTWNDVMNYIACMCAWSKSNKLKYTGVYGVPRGGLILAVLLSHALDIPLLMAPTEGCLIVDDIADSGRTLCHFTTNDTQFKKYFITTMFYDERSCVEPDFWLTRKTDAWIYFPWEVD